MAQLPPSLDDTSHHERILERVIGSTVGWPRSYRHCLGGLLFVLYLYVAQFEGGMLAFFLALTFYGALQRWVIEEPEPGQLADAYIWAALTFPVATAGLVIWWRFLGSEALQSWSTHVWFPLAVVAIALGFDRRKRRLSPTESLGAALSSASRNRNRSRDEQPPNA